MPPIATTHTGSLPRPEALTAALIEIESGREPEGFQELADQAVADSVRAQRRVGISIVNDGEQSKTGYSTYVRDRLSGFAGEATARPPASDLKEHPDFAALAAKLRGRPSAKLPPCSGPIALVDRDAVHRDIDRLLAASSADGVDAPQLFMSAASPGLVAMFFENQYYASREEYLRAIAAAMAYEYRAIVEAGIVLQLDCPDFAMSHNSVFQDLEIEEFRREVALAVEVLNDAVDGLDPSMMRVHLCWGNYESPHTTDVPLEAVIAEVAKVRPAGISVEAANPRHGHEWKVFESFSLPEDKYLLPGVIDTTTNFVEHPELVAQRLGNYTALLGTERVVASTDCGFETFIGRDRVARSVVWAKLQALAEGARIASGT